MRKTLIIIMLAATSFAESYRLKTDTTVEVSRDGEPIGVKTLKAGTIIIEIIEYKLDTRPN